MSWEPVGREDLDLPPHDDIGTLPLDDVVESLEFIFDESTWAKPIYTSGPTHGEGSGAFQGAALAPDGRVILAPRDSSNVGIFDPADDSYTSGPTHGEGSGAFIGAALAPQGRVIFVPYNSDNIGVFDGFAQTRNPRNTALHPLINGGGI